MSPHRIVHLTLNIPGPLAMSKLAALGMEVIKVEPASGDPLEGYYPDWYRELHAHQKILRLDLKSADGCARFDELLGTAELFVSSLRPSALQNLGLTRNTLATRFPKLHTVRIQGYPEPRSNEPAHDLTCQAEAGLLSPPSLPRALIADFAAAERVFSMSLLALLRARDSAAGSATENIVCMSEMAEEFAKPVRMGMTSPTGPLGGSLPQYQMYRAQDGWIAVAALEPHFLERLLRALELKKPDAKEFERIFGSRRRSEWEKLAAEKDLPIVSLKTTE